MGGVTVRGIISSSRRREGRVIIKHAILVDGHERFD